jgi:type VI secretion system protein ImpK
MQQDLANLVHPVLRYGLLLKERLDRGETPSLEIEQAALRTLLLSDLEAGRWIEFGGEADVGGLTFGEAGEVRAQPGGSQFLGGRYALVCWLDELFILHTMWGETWNERKLEVALYGSNERAWRFWEQARLAENRPTLDALEVFFLCVMEGFRGELGENPDRLRDWCKAVQLKLSRLGEQAPQPPELEPPINVPPLYGPDSFRRTLYWTCVLLLFLVPLFTFLLVQHLAD